MKKLTKKQKMLQEEKHEKKSKIEDPLALEGIDDLSSASIKRLNEEGIFSTFQLIHKNPVWLHDVTDYEKEKCSRIFKQAKQKLTDVGLLKPDEMSATECLVLRKTVKKIAFGCAPIDNILNGGVELGSCTQIYGENGGGKTQSSHVLCVQAQRPIPDGGLAEEGKAPPLIYFIATENTFRPERIIEIAAGKGLLPDIPEELKTRIAEGKQLKPDDQKKVNDIIAKQELEAEKYLNNIIVKRVTDANAQAQAVHDLIKMVQVVPIKLIILDSGTALIRGSYMGIANMNPKFKLLNDMCQELLSIAELNNIAVVFVNQIWTNPDRNPGDPEEEPYGGNIMGHAFPYILKVEKSGRRHRITIKKSPYQGNNSVRFEIKDSGFVEIKDE